jgi:hypothetical protein|tara:strand:+ start:428 stop:1210 length:783 start_codon:yes stop_codon:yes gene_type:complete
MRLFELTEAPRLPRNIRNNNPGNIKLSGDKWQGSSGDDGKFVKFDSPEMGARAMARILNNYQKKHGLKTIKDIVNRWAPSGDNNDPNAYANYVANNIGIDSNSEVDFAKNPELQAKVMKQMIDFEGGKGSGYFTPDVIRSGVALASGKPTDKPARIQPARIQPAVYNPPSTGVDVARLPGPGTSRYNVKRGMQGQSVQDLQARLTGLGYNLGKSGADGKFGPATRQAVQQFQKDYGLSVDGVAGDQTVTALNKISPISSA